MGKKSRNKTVTVVTPEIGAPLHIKHLGKPMFVAATILNTETTMEAWEQNSEEGVFTALADDSLHVFPVTEIPEGKPGQSLGFLVFTTPELTQGGKAVGDFLPFLVGETIAWRAPKLGQFLTEDDEVLEQFKQSAAFYAEKFSGYDSVFKIEEAVNVTGWSGTLTMRIDQQINNLT